MLSTSSANMPSVMARSRRRAGRRWAAIATTRAKAAPATVETSRASGLTAAMAGNRHALMMADAVSSSVSARHAWTLRMAPPLTLRSSRAPLAPPPKAGTQREGKRRARRTGSVASPRDQPTRRPPCRGSRRSRTAPGLSVYSRPSPPSSPAEGETDTFFPHFTRSDPIVISGCQGGAVSADAR